MEQKFEIKSGKVVLSDPCYELGIWCQGVIDKVKNGEWIGKAEHLDAGDWGQRVAVLFAYHKNYPTTSDDIISDGELLPFEGGVDSGQFGYFDFEGYRNDDSIKNVARICTNPEHIICEDEPWYSICCDRTIQGDSWGVIPLGVVSSSGYGDGSYPTYGIKNNEGQYVGFTTIFISKDEDEDNEDMFEDDELDPAGGHGLSSHE